MSIRLERAATLAVTATFFTAVVFADGSGAAAQDQIPVVVKSEPVLQFSAEPVVQPLPEEAVEEAGASDAAAQDDTALSAASLAELVAAQPQPEALSREMQCLAGAVYFESMGEPLDGQLAVGRVVVARAKSGRFPNSYCGVVFQRSQFSFVRGNAMPAIKTASQAWKRAVAIAQIAHEGTWQSKVEGALFFHAARISPGWNRTRLARIDGHVFYR